MSLDVYHRVIDQLRDVNFSGRISPYLMNESLLDKRLPALIAYARQQCPQSWIAINTNGDALSESLAERLFEAGLNCMDVNAYDDTSQYEAYMALAERMVARYPEIQLTSGYLDPNFNAPDLLSIKLLLPGYGDWSVALMTNSIFGIDQSSAMSWGHTWRPRATVQRPFQQMYVNHRGEAVLCCNDWRFEVVMGDTAEAPLHEIWNNDKYRTYREHPSARPASAVVRLVRLPGQVWS